VLELASIQGAAFDARSLDDLVPEDRPLDVDAQLVQLIRRELVRPDPAAEQRYSFRHPLVRDVVYASVPKQTRAELHERLASAGPGRAAARFHRDQARNLRAELGLPGG